RDALSIHRPRQEAIASRSQIGECHFALVRRAAPVRATAFQFDLIAEIITRTETGRDEVDVKRVAVPWELEVLQLRLPERRNRLRLARDADAADEDGWHARRQIVSRNDSDHAGDVAGPQDSRTIPDGRVHFPNRQALAPEVGSDPAGCRIQPIESASGRGEDVPGGILDNRRHLVAGKPLRGGVAGKPRPVVSGTIDTYQTAAIACPPDAPLRVADQIPNRSRRDAVLDSEPLESFVAVP